MDELQAFLGKLGDEALVSELDDLSFGKRKRTDPWAIVRLAGQKSARVSKDGKTVVAKGGEYFYAEKPYVATMDETSEAYNPEAKPPYAMDDASFAATSEFLIIPFAINKERVLFNDEGRDSILCFSRDTVIPDLRFRDGALPLHPFADTCAECPHSTRIEGASSAKCNIQGTLLGMDAKFRPVVMYFTKGSIIAFSAFVDALKEVNDRYAKEGKRWHMSSQVMSITSHLTEYKGKQYYEAVFPTLDEIANPKSRLVAQQMEGVWKRMTPVRSLWHPKFMTPEHRLEVQWQINRGSISSGTSADDTVPERRALGGHQFQRNRPPVAAQAESLEDNSLANAFSDQ